MKNTGQHNLRRSIEGRLGFLFLVLLLGAVAWRAADRGTVVWSEFTRAGEPGDIAVAGQTIAIAKTADDRVQVIDGESSTDVEFPRPLRLAPDGTGGWYVAGLLSAELGHINPRTGEFSLTEFPSGVVIAGVVAVARDIWVAGYFRHRVDNVDKKYIYLPEYGDYRWFAVRYSGGVPAGRAVIAPKPDISGTVEMHEESGGAWLLLADADAVFVVNDQAETLTRIGQRNQQVEWSVQTPARPTAAVLLDDVVLIASARDGVIEALDGLDGARRWRADVPRGITDMVLFDGRVILCDWRGDRLSLFDVAKRSAVSQRRLAGGPRRLVADGEALWVLLSTANEVVRLDRELNVTERVQLMEVPAQ